MDTDSPRAEDPDGGDRRDESWVRVRVCNATTLGA